MYRRVVFAALALGVLPAFGFQADLLPVGRRPEARDLTGQLAIGGPNGTVHVTIDDVVDAHGDPLDGTLLLQLRLRVNGLRRRIGIPLAVAGGSGTATEDLGLRPGDHVIVNEVRVRGPDRRTVAQAGVVTADVSPAPAPPAPPASLAQCQAALDACTADLDQCNEDLDDCLSVG